MKQLVKVMYINEAFSVVLSMGFFCVCQALVTKLQNWRICAKVKP